MKLHKHTLQDIIEIDWKEVNMTLNGKNIKLPTSEIIPLRYKFKIRRMIEREPLLFHTMLKLGITCFPLLVKDSEEAV